MLLSLSVAGYIEWARGKPEMVSWGAEFGNVVQQLAFAYAGGWIFNLLVVEVPRIRRERKWLEILLPYFGPICEGVKFFFLGALYEADIKDPGEGKLLEFKDLMDARIEALRGNGFSEVAIAQACERDLAGYFGNVDRTMTRMISASSEFDGDLVHMLRILHNAPALSTFAAGGQAARRNFAKMDEDALRFMNRGGELIDLQRRATWFAAAVRRNRHDLGV